MRNICRCYVQTGLTDLHNEQKSQRTVERFRRLQLGQANPVVGLKPNK